MIMDIKQPTTLPPFNADLSAYGYPGDMKNGQRADRAEAVLKEYKRLLGDGQPPNTNDVQDLLSDLLHWAHREGYDVVEESDDITELCVSAYDNFKSESGGDQ